jgi:hypothetical protein
MAKNGVDDRGSGVRFPAVMGIFFFTTAFRLALGPTQPSIQWVPGALSLDVKLMWREADHSPPSSAEVKECVDLYLHSPNKVSMAWYLFKHKDNFTFTFTKKLKAVSIRGMLCTIQFRKFGFP